MPDRDRVDGLVADLGFELQPWQQAILDQMLEQHGPKMKIRNGQGPWREGRTCRCGRAWPHPTEQTIDAVLNAWRGRGPYHDRQRGILRHHWPRLAQALDQLEREQRKPDQVQVVPERPASRASAIAGMSIVAGAMDETEEFRRHYQTSFPDTLPCPDCRDGKHRSCSGIAFNHADEQVPCPCEQANHEERP